MRKTLLTFSLGMLSSAVLVWYSAGRPAIACFVIGICFTLCSGIAILSSGRMLRRCAALLDAAADLMEKPSRRAKARARRAPAPARTHLEEDLYTALRNMGATEKHAAATAHRTATANPAATFQDAMAVALRSQA